MCPVITGETCELDPNLSSKSLQSLALPCFHIAGHALVFILAVSCTCIWFVTFLVLLGLASCHFHFWLNLWKLFSPLLCLAHWQPWQLTWMLISLLAYTSPLPLGFWSLNAWVGIDVLSLPTWDIYYIWQPLRGSSCDTSSKSQEIHVMTHLLAACQILCKHYAKYIICWSLTTTLRSNYYYLYLIEKFWIVFYPFCCYDTDILDSVLFLQRVLVFFKEAVTCLDSSCALCLTCSG